MSKKYGDKVVYVRNGEELNAIVTQSTQEPDGEHLVLSYADPAFRAVLVQQQSKVMATAFGVASFKEGATNGWKEDEEKKYSFAFGGQFGSLEPSGAVFPQGRGTAVKISATEFIQNLKDRNADQQKLIDDLKHEIAVLEGDKAELDHQLEKAKDALSAEAKDTVQADPTENLVEYHKEEAEKPEPPVDAQP